MKIVVDSNIAFSAIAYTSGRVGNLFFHAPDVSFFVCDHVFAEIRRHRPKLIAHTGFSEQEIEEMERRVFQRVTFVREELIPFEFWQKAAAMVRDVDIDDAPHVALTLLLDAKLWTGDKKLSNGLRAKGFTDVVDTEALSTLLMR